MTPLNGTKTHPLTAHAVAVLRRLDGSGPKPRQTFNPGVVNRLLREDLVEIVQRRSPFVKHLGGDIDHLSITDAGRAALNAH